jgi:hypothetical protein
MTDPFLHDQAHTDQLEAELRDIALVSWVLYRQYMRAGFGSDEAMELVAVWNAHFADRTCGT